MFSLKNRKYYRQIIKLFKRNIERKKEKSSRFFAFFIYFLVVACGVWSNRCLYVCVCVLVVILGIGDCAPANFHQIIDFYIEDNRIKKVTRRKMNE
jgi:dolichol kinase